MPGKGPEAWGQIGMVGKQVKFASFASAVSSLAMLTKIETALASAVRNSRVPVRETRKLLKARTVAQAENTPLFQFMIELMEQVGVGRLRLAATSLFKLTFAVTDCPVCGLFEVESKTKTCYVTSDALTEFFTKDLLLPAAVEETKCTNHKDPECEFEVSIQPLAVYRVVLDTCDLKIVSLLAGSRPRTEIEAECELDAAELQFRMDSLRDYHIVDARDALTDVGLTYHKYGSGIVLHKDDEMDPPWKDRSRVSEAIADAQSFADALNKTADKRPFIEVSESNLVNLAEEAKKCRGFAELLAKHFKTDDMQKG